MLEEVLHHLRLDDEPVAVEELRVAVQEILGEQRDLLGPFAEGRNDDLDDVEAIVEILAKLAGCDRVLEILICRCNDSNVNFDDGFAADPRELPILQNMEDLGLEGRVEIADLVEKNRAMIGRFELANLQLVRAGEGPALVPEQLALEKLPGHGGAVYLHERPTLTGRSVVDGPGRHVLPGPGLAANQDGDMHLGGLLDHPPELLHLGAAPEACFLLESSGQFVHRRAPPLPTRSGAHPFDRVLKVIGFEGLLEKIVGAQRSGLSDSLGMGGVEEHDDWPGIPALEFESTEEVDAVGPGKFHGHHAEVEA